MTGCFHLELNGERIDRLGDFEIGQDGYFEGIEAGYIINALIYRLKTGDLLTIVCDLAE